MIAIHRIHVVRMGFPFQRAGRQAHEAHRRHHRRRRGTCHRLRARGLCLWPFRQARARRAFRSISDGARSDRVRQAGRAASDQASRTKRAGAAVQQSPRLCRPGLHGAPCGAQPRPAILLLEGRPDGRTAGPRDTRRRRPRGSGAPDARRHQRQGLRPQLHRPRQPRQYRGQAVQSELGAGLRAATRAGTGAACGPHHAAHAQQGLDRRRQAGRGGRTQYRRRLFRRLGRGQFPRHGPFAGRPRGRPGRRHLRPFLEQRGGAADPPRHRHGERRPAGAAQTPGTGCDDRTGRSPISAASPKRAGDGRAPKWESCTGPARSSSPPIRRKRRWAARRTAG